jgi:acyl carrier protein
VRDRFGLVVPCRLHVLERLPRTAEGSVDLAALGTGSRPRARLRGEHLPPANAAERLIADIWRDVLEVDAVSAGDNFFDLGGHSLLLTRVRSRLAEAFSREIPVVELFRHPTVRALATYLEGTRESPAFGAVDERARKQRAAMGRRRSRAGPRTEGEIDG